MEQPKTPTSNNDRQRKQQPRAKQAWHRPTMIFVPLQNTALNKGSGGDFSFSSVTPG